MSADDLLHDLLQAATSAPGARELLALGGASIPWTTHPDSVSTKEFLTVYEVRAAKATANLTRQGNWAAFMPALRATQLDRVLLHSTQLRSGEFALAVTDSRVATLVGVLLL